MKSESEVAQLCPTLRDPMDYSLPGSSIHGIFQARVLEWGAIAFSDLCIGLKTKIRLMINIFQFYKDQERKVVSIFLIGFLLSDSRKNKM